MSRIRLAVLMAAFALVPAAAHAQSTITACYVPKTGSMYRIEAEGAPDTCKSNHVEFSWQSGGTIFTRRLSPLKDVAPTNFEQTFASCEAGETVVGGGYATAPNGPVSVPASMPAGPQPGLWAEQGWFIDVRNVGPSTIQIQAIAICAKPAA